MNSDTWVSQVTSWTDAGIALVLVWSLSRSPYVELAEVTTGTKQALGTTMIIHQSDTISIGSIPLHPQAVQLQCVDEQIQKKRRKRQGGSFTPFYGLAPVAWTQSKVRTRTRLGQVG